MTQGGAHQRRPEITDAENTAQFGKALQDQSAGRHRALNIAYSVAPGQRLGVILEEHFDDRGEQIDLALATYAFMYFGPTEYDESMVDVTDRMSKGAYFVSVGINPARLGTGEMNRRFRFLQYFRQQFSVNTCFDSSVLRRK